MKKELENYLSNLDNLKSFLFEQTNFGWDKIEPTFYIIASAANNKIWWWDDKIMIKESTTPYIYYIGGTWKLKNVLKSFSDEEFHFTQLKDYLLEVEKEFNVEFKDIVIS